MVYLFIGEDSLSKDLQLKKIKQEFLAKELEQFNLDTLFAEELTLRDLQEKLLFLPISPAKSDSKKQAAPPGPRVSGGAKSPKRIIVIKNAQNLKENIKEFILKYAKNQHKHIILILDISRQDKKDGFINNLYRFVNICRFKETKRIDSFTLCRSIDLNKPDYALRLLNQLLKDGERPERILGGLRYAWERNVTNHFEMKRRLKLLLNCDMEIKTGRLRPAFALEKLIISLCSFGKPFH